MDNAQVNAMLREALDYLDRIATSLETIAGECANLEEDPSVPCSGERYCRCDECWEKNSDGS